MKQTSSITRAMTAAQEATAKAKANTYAVALHELGDDCAKFLREAVNAR